MALDVSILIYFVQLHAVAVTPWAQVFIEGRPSNTCAVCPDFWSAT